MKHLLLASASLVAFAGAASAEITYSGSAKLGFNTETEVDGADVSGEMGFYWAGDLILSAQQELDNGLTFAGSVDVKLARDDQANYDMRSEDFEISLTAGEAGGLYFGNTEYAPVSYWKSAGVMIADGFSEQDNEYVLKGEIVYGNVKAGLSTPVLDDTVGQIGLGLNATVGTFDVAFGYQDALSDAWPVSTVAAEFADPYAVAQPGNSAAENHGDASDLNGNEIIAISAGTTLSGATTRFAYATTDYANGDAQDSLGVAATYPVGAVALTGQLVLEDGDKADGTTWLLRAAYKEAAYAVTGTIDSRARAGDTDNDLRWDLQGSYKLDNGVQIFAGILHRDSFMGGNGGEAYYVGAEYDLGKGGKVIASYADASNTSKGYREDDEVGARKYQDGTTLEISFKF